MAWKIVPDSAADLQPDFKPKSDAIFEEVPLTITVKDQTFLDSPDLDTKELLEAFNASKEGSKTSCPSPQAYKEAFEDAQADKIIAVTLSHNLSGSYNSARVAKDLVLEKHPEKQIHIIDSYATGGTELLIVLKADELIAQGKSFPEVVEELENFKKNLETLYTLSHFENLMKNGRMNKIVGKVAQTFSIRVIGKETNGAVDILYKVRGEAKAIKKLVTEMGKLKNMDGVDVIIIEIFNKPGAQVTKNLIKKTYPNVGEIQILEGGGINTFYGEEGGLIVSF